MKVLIVTDNNANKIMHIVDGFNANKDLEIKVIHQKLKQHVRLYSIIEKIGYKLKLPVDLDKLNFRILESCKEFKPDILFIIKGNLVKPKTLKKVKLLLPKTKIISWANDNMVASHNRSLYYTWGLKNYDHVFIMKSYDIDKMKELGAKKVDVFTKAYSKIYHKPCLEGETSSFNHDVLFIGYAEKERIESMNFLAENGIKIEIYGSGWHKIDKSQLHKNLIVHGHDLVGKDYADAISCSKISLCFLRKVNGDKITSRTIEIPACKGFMLAERTDEQKELFEEDKEAVYFNTNKELLEKVKYYLEHNEERQNISNNGYQRCISSDYSFENMVRLILNDVLSKEN